MAAASLVVGHASTARAQKTPPADEAQVDRPSFTGTTSVSHELARVQEDATARFPRMAAFRDAMQPWYDLKQGIAEDTGLDFALSYAALAASDDPGDRETARELLDTLAP